MGPPAVSKSKYFFREIIRASSQGYGNHRSARPAPTLSAKRPIYSMHTRTKVTSNGNDAEEGYATTAKNSILIEVEVENAKNLSGRYGLKSGSRMTCVAGLGNIKGNAFTDTDIGYFCVH